MRPSTAAIGRAMLLLAAAGAIVFGALRLHAADRCSADSRQAFAITLGAAPGRIQTLVAGIEHDCRGAGALAAAVPALLRAGDGPQALALARAATRREPDNFVTWAALEAAELPRDRAAAERARQRAHALDPRYRPAQRPLLTAPPARASA